MLSRPEGLEAEEIDSVWGSAFLLGYLGCRIISFSDTQRTNLELGKPTIINLGPLRVELPVKHNISDESWIKTTITLDEYFPSRHNYGEGCKDPLT